MTPQQLTDSVLAAIDGDTPRAPEGESFRVMCTEAAGARFAEKVARLMAAELRPGIRFGRVLMIEPLDEVSTEVVLEVLP